MLFENCLKTLKIDHNLSTVPYLLRLLDILYERNMSVDYTLCVAPSSPDENIKNKKMLVTVIQRILMEKDDELAYMVELAANFLTLYANGK